MLRRLRHRVGQFLGALRPRVDARAREEAHAWLDAPLRPLFDAMMPRDQQHGIEVFRRVRAHAGNDRALLAAALLHDCGKGRVALWQRVAHVLLGALAPGVRAQVATERGAAWRRAFWRLLHHPAIGAELAARAGADPEIVRIIREQEAPHPDARLAILQAADEA
jgi:hypothetical protein